MKKILLIFCILSISLLSFAADLNPFAYRLKSEFNPSTLTLTVNFSLNAPAEYMKLAISDGTTDVWTKEYLAASYASGKVPKATYSEEINVSGLPSKTPLTWRVDVKGFGNASTQYATYVPIYSASSVDIDNNPENANFGTVFCTDHAPNTKENANYSSYLCYYDGPGLYIVNADATARRMPFVDKVRYGYNGGVNSDRTAFGTAKAHVPWRVRVSDDGRIFITSQSTDGQVLWEAKKECFSATTKDEWSANTGWTKIMADDNANTKLQTTKKANTGNSSACNQHSHCNIFNIFTTGGEFIAGPNCGFDVRGAGEELTIVMLSGDKQAIESFTPIHYRCDEYKLGTATIWEKAPTRNLYWGRALYGEGVQVQYDKTGNVWMCQHRGEKADNVSTLMRYNVSTKERDYDEDFTTYRRCGGIRFNEDFTQMIVASKGSGSKGGGATLYPVDQSSGKPIWESGTTIQMQSVTGQSLMDFAWDYAGNLYVAADNGHKLAVYAMPYDASRVLSTPAASKYTFSVDCEPGATYSVTTICDPEEGGTITCQLGGNTRAVGMLTDIPSCTELTVTATPEHGYQFLYWEDDEKNVVSTNTEYTFYVTRDITLTAKFEYATYSNITWHNLFLDNEDDKNLISDDNRNVGLWRLYQVQFQSYASGTRNDKGNVNGYSEYDVGGFLGTSARFDKNTEYLSTSTTNQDYEFAWLGKFLEYVNGSKLSGNLQWGYFLYLLVNRTDIARGSNGSNVGLTKGANCKSFVEYGKPMYWRPWWTKYACDLPDTMTYTDNMPIAWTKLSCANTVIKNDVGTTITPHPTSWYQWNNAPDGKAHDQSQYLLAWRANSAIGDTIVHHVYRSNMELHASYVKKNIDEEDNVDVNTNDASNDDVIKLMQNRHFVDLNPDTTVQPTHTLTVTRKLRAGMYNTICLPFGVDLTGLQEGHYLKNAEAWEFAGSTSDTYNESGDPVTVLNFNKVTTLEAGKPYFIKLKGNEDVTTDMTFSGVSSKPYVYPQSGGGLIFHPTINPTTIPAGALILVANDRLAVNTEDGQMLGLRGYFQIDETDPIFASEIKQRAAEGHVYLSFKKPVTTSVPLAPEAEQPRKPQVSKIMRDGKIYIIRDGVTYTITGARVR